MNTTTTDGIRQAGLVTVNEGEVKAHINQLITGAVEEMLNQLLDAEADALCQAQRYEQVVQALACG